MYTLSNGTGDEMENLKKSNGTGYLKNAFYTPKDAAELLGVSQKTFYRNIKDYTFDVVKIGGRYYVPKNGFDSFLKRW